MKKLLAVLIMSIFLFSLCSAIISDLGTFKQGEDIILVQICDTCTWNNITVYAPNSTQLVFNEVMTSIGNKQFTYLLNSNNTVGIGI